MKLNCLGCGNPINLGDEYKNYTGSIRCNACSAILKVKLKESEILEMEFLRFAIPSVEEDAIPFVEKMPLKEGYSSPQRRPVR